MHTAPSTKTPETPRQLLRLLLTKSHESSCVLSKADSASRNEAGRRRGCRRLQLQRGDRILDLEAFV